MFAADMHCDTISEMYHDRKRGKHTNLLSNDLQVDLFRLKRGGYVLQNFAVFVDIKEEPDPYRCANGQIRLFREEIERYKNQIRPAVTAEELEQNRREGYISAVLTLEEGEVCAGSLKKLKAFYTKGVRMMTFTWKYENSLAAAGGLTDLGFMFLEEMERMGMVPDVSHLSDAGIFDVCRHAKKPVAASHSNARALCGKARNLTDEMIRAVASGGGVIGVNYYRPFLNEKTDYADESEGVAYIADHIMHLIRTGGILCAGLGSDFDGIHGMGGMADCSKLPRLAKELSGRGLSEREIEAVFYQNVLRLYKECW
ncbi:hypothetical protein IMSAGC012_01441 [Lachnospiraceae bacterium]|nr:hypothetical protein IMSAGC012_01441 [Lachnospiraceae bacterium]